MSCEFPKDSAYISTRLTEVVPARAFSNTKKDMILLYWSCELFKEDEKNKRAEIQHGAKAENVICGKSRK